MPSNNNTVHFSLREFKSIAVLAVAAASNSVRKIRVDDQVFRKLRMNMVATDETRQHLLEALTVIMREIAERATSRNVRYADVEALVGGTADRIPDGEDGEAEWAAMEDLEGEPTLDRFRRDGKTYFVVDWEPTVEPRANIPLNLIAAFERERRALVRRTYIEDEAVEAGN